jgi:hypothetical protein
MADYEMAVQGDYTSVQVGTTIVNTLNPVTFEQRKLAFNAINNAESLDDHKDEPIEIIGIVQKNATRTDIETGEVKPCVQTILVADAGIGYYSQSVGVARSAAAILDSMGSPEQWPDGKLTVMCSERRINGGRQLKQLAVL